MITYKQNGGKISTENIDKASNLADQISNRYRGTEFRNLGSRKMAFAREALTEILSSLNQAKKVATKITVKTPPNRAMAQIEISRGVTLLKFAVDSGITNSYIRFSPQREYP